jgi:hypothetical protein
MQAFMPTRGAMLISSSFLWLSSPSYLPSSTPFKVNSMNFVVAYISFAEIHDKGFPGLDTSTIPPSLMDLRAFSPMMEMAHSFV